MFPLSSLTPEMEMFPLSSLTPEIWENGKTKQEEVGITLS